MFDISRIQIGAATYHGLVTSGDRMSPIALHLHGTGGNFYGNQIATEFALIYKKHGVRFATLNLPAHDMGYETEVFSEYLPALHAWIDALAGGQFVLQGHSLGALKILDYVKRSDASAQCAGAVLLSPFDIVAFYSGMHPELTARLQKQAKSLMADNGSLTRVSADMFNVWPISVSTYLEMIEEGGPADRFPSRDLTKLRQGKWLPDIPTIVFLGGEDFAAYPSPSIVFNSLSSVQGKLSAHLIEGAPHNFDGKIGAVGAKLEGWLSEIRI